MCRLKWTLTLKAREDKKNTRQLGRNLWEEHSHVNAGVGDGDDEERQLGDIAVYCGDVVGGWKRVGEEEKAKDSKKKEGAKIQNVYLE